MKGVDKHYVIVALLGQVKGEHGEREQRLQLQDLVSRTSGGWVERLIAVNQMCGRETGPGFCTDNSVVLKSHDMNEILHELLGEIFIEHPALPVSVEHSFNCRY